MSKSLKDSLIIGFALFAIFFGAGNLIFPPSLGNISGSHYPLAILGFIITGVGLPLLGVLACVISGGDFIKISNRVNRSFSLLLNISLMLALGPLLVIPRTAATTYELGVYPLFPSASPLLSIIIYFSITLFFVLNPSRVVDVIGKYLTPILLLILATIIIKGIFTPIGSTTPPNINNVFSHALLEGYQTMDALGSVIIATIIVKSIKAKGYTKKKDISKMALRSGLVSVTGLGLIYGGLTYLGAQTINLAPSDITRTSLVILIAERTLSYFGSTALGLAVSLACLTTSIALTTAVSEFFTKLFNNKITYKTNVLFISTLSIGVATLGVEQIIKFAAPILSILYPIVMILIAITYLGEWVDNTTVTLTTYTALLFSTLSTMSTIGRGNEPLQNVLNNIPLNNVGFGWLLPSVIIFILSSLYMKKIYNMASS